MAPSHRPYTAHADNPYQATKIAAERAVLAADGQNDSSAVATVAIRPTHIFGQRCEDDLVDFLANVNVCFGAGVRLVGDGSHGANMSMCHVENCALLHLLAAAQASRVDVRGRAFFAQDFDDNIVHVYRRLSGRSPPFVTLPYWLLWVLVHMSLSVHWLVRVLTLGRLALVAPKTGLHHGALAAALPCTASSLRGRTTLGYESLASFDAAVSNALGPPAPLIDTEQVSEALKRAFRRAQHQ